MIEILQDDIDTASLYMVQACCCANELEIARFVAAVITTPGVRHKNVLNCIEALHSLQLGQPLPAAFQCFPQTHMDTFFAFLSHIEEENLSLYQSERSVIEMECASVEKASIWMNLASHAETYPSAQIVYMLRACESLRNALVAAQCLTEKQPLFMSLCGTSLSLSCFVLHLLSR